jgi:hypothetical protein
MAGLLSYNSHMTVIKSYSLTVWLWYLETAVVVLVMVVGIHSCCGR